MSHVLSITNGAAFQAQKYLGFLTSIDDLYVGGSLSLKLRPARKGCPQQKTKVNGNGDLALIESPQDYESRYEEWAQQMFPDVEVTEEERDVLKTAIRVGEAAKRLAHDDATVELIKMLGLNRAK